MKRNTQAIFMIAALLSCQNTFSSQPNIRNARARLGQIKKQVDDKAQISPADINSIRTDLAKILNDKTFQKEAGAIRQAFENKILAQQKNEKLKSGLGLELRTIEEQRKEAALVAKLNQAIHRSGSRAIIEGVQSASLLQSALIDESNAAKELSTMKKAQAKKTNIPELKAKLTKEAQVLDQRVSVASNRLSSVQQEIKKLQQNLVVPNLNNAKLNDPSTQAAVLAETNAIATIASNLSQPMSSPIDRPQAVAQTTAQLDQAARIRPLLPASQAQVVAKDIAETQALLRQADSPIASIVSAGNQLVQDAVNGARTAIAAVTASAGNTNLAADAAPIASLLIAPADERKEDESARRANEKKSSYK